MTSYLLYNAYNDYCSRLHYYSFVELDLTTCGYNCFEVSIVFDIYVLVFSTLVLLLEI